MQIPRNNVDRWGIGTRNKRARFSRRNYYTRFDLIMQKKESLFEILKSIFILNVASNLALGLTIVHTFLKLINIIFLELLNYTKLAIDLAT